MRQKGGKACRVLLPPILEIAHRKTPEPEVQKQSPQGGAEVNSPEGQRCAAAGTAKRTCAKRVRANMSVCVRSSASGQSEQNDCLSPTTIPMRPNPLTAANTFQCDYVCKFKRRKNVRKRERGWRAEAASSRPACRSAINFYSKRLGRMYCINTVTSNCEK